MNKFLYNTQDKIISCITGGNLVTAVHLIRLSGFSNLKFLEPFIDYKISKIKPRYSHFINLLNESDILDQILLVYFPAPYSYSGENIIEISVHGNPLNVNRILDLFIHQCGFRMAYPGEFTYRAMKNKKLNLSQVEGLDLFFNAQNIFSMNQGLSLLSGNLQDKFLALYSQYKYHRACLEILFDFSDDVGSEQSQKLFSDSAKQLASTINYFIDLTKYKSENIIKPQVVLLGLPNAGKSTVFNSLLDDERSIVSNIAGTTRDYISETISLDGNNFELIDTAGINLHSHDSIEAVGIKKALKIIDQSFFRILVINPFIATDLDEFLKQLPSIDMIIFTHNDLSEFEGKLGPIEPKLPEVRWSYRTNKENFAKDQIFNAIQCKFSELTQAQPILIQRHKNIFQELEISWNSYSHLIEKTTDLAVIDASLQEIGAIIEELVGIVSPNQVLSDIFTQFCIGK